MRSRTGSLPCSRWRWRYFAPPPCRAVADPLAQLGDQPRHPVAVCAELLRRWIDVGLEDVHWGDGTANYKVVRRLEGGSSQL